MLTDRTNCDAHLLCVNARYYSDPHTVYKAGDGNDTNPPGFCEVLGITDEAAFM
jgi:hypothetical protein